MPSEDYYRGKEWMKGAITAILNRLVLYFIIVGVLALFYCAFGIGMDDSDLNGWKRSGMRIYTDYKSGIEYLATSQGGLIKRYW